MFNFTNEENNKRFSGNSNEYKISINGKTKNIEYEISKRKEKEINEGLEKYMPIGSIVSLNNDEDLKMIIGFNYESNDIVYDYIACSYPFGIDREHMTSVFNHNQINEIYHIGYVDIHGKKYRADLKNEHPRNRGLSR